MRCISTDALSTYYQLLNYSTNYDDHLHCGIGDETVAT